MLSEKLTELQAEVLELQHTKEESRAAFETDRGCLQERLLAAQADAQVRGAGAIPPWGRGSSVAR